MYHNSQEFSSTDVPSEILDLLKEFTLFKSAPPDFFISIAGRLKQWLVSPQQAIISQGDESRAMYWLVKGSVGVTSHDREELFAELGPGTFFGEIGILFGRPRTATVVALTRCLVVSLTSEALNAVLSLYPQIFQAIKNEAQERLALLEKKPTKAPVAGLKRKLDVITDGPPIHDIVAGIPFFESLPSHIIHRLALSIEPQVYDPFEYVLKQDTPGQDIYYIVDGMAEVIDERANVVKARLQRGSYFGEMGFLAVSSRRTASVRSITQLECLVLTEKTLTTVCAKYPSVTEEIRATADIRLAGNVHLSDTPKESSPKHSSVLAYSLTADQLPPTPPAMFDPVVSPFGNYNITKAWKINTKIEVPQPPSPQYDDENDDNDCFLFHSLKRTNRHGRRGSLFNLGPFPDNILIEIFQYLPLPTLMKLQRVCLYWRRLLGSSIELVQSLDLTPYNNSITDESIIPITNFVGTRPCHVDISNCFHLTDGGFKYLLNGIGYARVQTFKMKSVWAVSGVRIVDISHTNIKNFLEEVDLSNCRKVNDAVISRLLGWNRENNGPMVTGCSNLKRLALNYCKHVTDRTMYHLAQFANEQLESFELSRCTGITDHGFSYWSMTMFPNLTRLNLSDCTFLTDQSMLALSRSCVNLEDLNLSFCCALSDLSIEVLSVGCVNLLHLNVAYCGSAVSDGSLQHIASRLTRLQSLSVRGCVRVTNRGIHAILRGCRDLRSLNATQCKHVT